MVHARLGEGALDRERSELLNLCKIPEFARVGANAWAPRGVCCLFTYTLLVKLALRKLVGWLVVEHGVWLVGCGAQGLAQHHA